MKNTAKFALTTLTVAMLAACSDDKTNDAPASPVVPEVKQLELPAVQKDSAWFKEAKSAVTEDLARTVNANKGAAKNIILFVGDGMGISTVTAARILEGQMQGGMGEEHQISFETLPFVGLSKTYNTNQQTPDSAGTMTAMTTGVKSKAGVLNIDESVARQDCTGSQGKELTTIAELAELKGKSTGIVSTARITHATPAAVYAKSPDRDYEYEAPAGCKDIALQMIEFAAGDGLDVVMGGGRRNFLPNTLVDVEGKKGKRKDNRNLVDEWKTKNPGGVYVETQAEFDAIPATSTRIMGLFNDSHMRYEADRKNDVKGEPSLSQMTAKSIEALSKNDKGYFLMVEAGRIDHGHHAGSAYNALTDTVELAKAVKVAMDKTSVEDTLIIVTADHSHVFTIAGYPTRGNPILGKVVGNNANGVAQNTPVLASDNMPYTTVGYLNGLGYASLGSETDGDVRYNSAADAGRKDLTAVDTTSPGFHQEALVPLSGGETHAGEDVGIFSRGPGAHLLTGTVEQNFIFHVMSYAGDLLP
ncbi:MAG: alkaline phosphatase [Hahellaceae bacterium]|nr:alkaline phosphatase [Hahellaceae bacterium]MCP5170141.1 alkaline phosphatase [Hahellaceae bacterium]